MWDTQHCGLEIAKYAFRVLSSSSTCLVRTIPLLIDSWGVVCVCVCAHLFIPTFFNWLLRWWHVLWVWISLCVKFDLFSSHLPFFECSVRCQRSNIKCLNRNWWNEHPFPTIGCLPFSLSLIFTLSLLFVPICLSRHVGIYQSFPSDLLPLTLSGFILNRFIAVTVRHKQVC